MHIFIHNGDEGTEIPVTILHVLPMATAFHRREAGGSTGTSRRRLDPGILDCSALPLIRRNFLAGEPGPAARAANWQV